MLSGRFTRRIFKRRELATVSACVCSTKADPDFSTYYQLVYYVGDTILYCVGESVSGVCGEVVDYGKSWVALDDVVSSHSSSCSEMGRRICKCNAASRLDQLRDDVHVVSFKSGIPVSFAPFKRPHRQFVIFPR